MKTSIFLAAAVFIVISCMALAPVFSQEAKVAEPGIKEGATEPDVMWILGQVISVEPLKSELTVSYMDYETDNEKAIIITVDATTAYENIKSLLELKPQDTVSIDYMVNAQGVNIARSISLEKIEDAPVLQNNDDLGIEPQKLMPGNATKQ